MKVSKDGFEWKWVECGRIFQANTVHDVKVRNVFDTPVEARYVRIYPLEYSSAMNMRAGVM